MTTDSTAQSASKARNKWALAGMILGIIIWTVGLVLLFLPPAQAVIVAAGIIASIVGLRRSKQVDDAGQPVYGGRGQAIAGMIMNCVAAPGILLWLIFYFTGSS